MPTRKTYLLHLYSSRSVSGRQWAARLEHLTDREVLHFSDPEALLSHLQELVHALDERDRPAEASEGANGPMIDAEKEERI